MILDIQSRLSEAARAASRTAFEVELPSATFQYPPRTDLGDHVWRFELRTQQRMGDGDHPHFMCTGCGTVACLPGVRVRIRTAPGSPRAVRRRDVDIQLKGRCDRCA